MTVKKDVTFLCGVVKPDSEELLDVGIIRLRGRTVDGKRPELKVSHNDPGLRYVLPGRCRMIILHEGVIIAVYARPRIKLLRMLEQGSPVGRRLIRKEKPLYAL
jgi:hypothetical protein